MVVEAGQPGKNQGDNAGLIGRYLLPVPLVASISREGCIVSSFRNILKRTMFGRSEMGIREEKAYVKIDALFTAVFSLACFLAGTAVILSTALVPTSIQEVGNIVTHYVWTVTLTFGALLTLVGRVWSRVKVEAAGSIGMAIGFAIYCSAIVAAGNAGGFIAAVFFLSLAVSFGYRGYVLNRLGKEGGGPDDARLLGFRIPD